MATEAQINANRANALHSTGPTTPAGKAKSSLNAVKTGLTGRTVLLPGDDAEAYQKHIERFQDKHKPAGDAEHNLVQSLADTEWRLLRIPSLEMGIYALGRLEFADKFAAEPDESVRNALIEAQTFLAYQRQLNNLSIQEGRLRRQREKDLTDLKDLQTKRRQDTNQKVSWSAQLYKEAKREGKPFNPAEFGFEISMQQIHEHIAFTEAMNRGENANLAVLKHRRAA